jgi:hypothetical protein
MRLTTEMCRHRHENNKPTDNMENSDTLKSTESRTAAGVGTGDLVQLLREDAARAAAEWEPFTQNHDPSYWRALRAAYAEGYVAGVTSGEPQDELSDDDRVSPTFESDDSDPHGLGGI